MDLNIKKVFVSYMIKKTPKITLSSTLMVIFVCLFTHVDLWGRQGDLALWQGQMSVEQKNREDTPGAVGEATALIDFMTSSASASFWTKVK